MVGCTSYGGTMSAGKGDRVRPYNRKLWDEGWDRVFGKKLCERGMPLPCKTCDIGWRCSAYDYQGDKND